jgi:hypothetical protein
MCVTCPVKLATNQVTPIEVEQDKTTALKGLTAGYFLQGPLPHVLSVT